MDRRNFMKTLAAGAAGATLASGATASASAAHFTRVRPSDPGWPSASEWQALDDRIGGSLISLQSPLDACVADPASTACADLFRELKNPYFIGDDPALTQTTGWVDAWVSSPSVYAVHARNAADVAAGVNFARAHNLRVVVKGGGHSYQGTSNAPDSLLIWTRAMNAIAIHDDFVPRGCAGVVAPQPAVSLGSGCIWGHVYDTVIAKGGRYVQGGGCSTVGVAGLIQSGGFGSFSKRFGTGGSSLLEAEIVTADGAIRVVNACSDPDLFWSLKGGGGGSWGAVTRLTLKTHDLPDYFGLAFGAISAQSDDAFKALIRRFVAFAADELANPGWGESVSFQSNNSLAFGMVFQGFDDGEAQRVWKPFLDWVGAAENGCSITVPMLIRSLPARKLYDPAFILANMPTALVRDDRPGASADNVLWAGDLGQVGQFMYGYDSAWLPAALLVADQQPQLVDALFAASRHRNVGLHFNKALSGSPADAVAASADTPMHPAVLDAFALAIIGAHGQPAFASIPGHEPYLAEARAGARQVADATREIRKVSAGIASYVSESNYFNDDFGHAYWGPHYARLRAAKDRYDPDGLFFVHNGVGADQWSTDGFTRRS